ncbi:MAG: hypothetical protein ABI178_02320 [Rhodanobacter sp.]
MLVEADAADFTLLLASSARHPFVSVPEDRIAPQEVLQMLADLAASIRPNFAPCAWMIVEDDEIVVCCRRCACQSKASCTSGTGLRRPAVAVDWLPVR